MQSFVVYVFPAPDSPEIKIDWLQGGGAEKVPPRFGVEERVSIARSIAL